MKLVLTAPWMSVGDSNAERIAIGGFTAVVETVQDLDQTVFEFTVLQDHLRIVGTGIRTSRLAAKTEAERLIEAAANGVRMTYLVQAHELEVGDVLPGDGEVTRVTETKGVIEVELKGEHGEPRIYAIHQRVLVR